MFIGASIEWRLNVCNWNNSYLQSSLFTDDTHTVNFRLATALALLVVGEGEEARRGKKNQPLHADLGSINPTPPALKLVALYGYIRNISLVPSKILREIPIINHS